jgi:AraC-like DNA-binding protein
VVDLDGVLLEWNSSGSHNIVREHFARPGLLIGFPIEGSRWVSAHGRELDKGHALVWKPGQVQEFVVFPDTRGLAIYVDTTLSGSIESQLCVSPVIPVEPIAYRNLMRICYQATQSCGTWRDEFPAVTKAVLRDRIFAALTQTLERTETSGSKGSQCLDSTQRWRIVQRAEKRLSTANLHSTISPDALALSLGVPRRTLFHAFQSTLGIGPHKFHRLIRLQRLRDALKNSAAEETSVTELAFEYGFSHLGRLAKEYREQFGEHPSQTLIRD